MLHPYGPVPEPAFEQSTLGSSRRSWWDVLSPGHHTLSPLLQAKSMGKATVLPCPIPCAPAPSGHRREGTAPAANGKVQGRGEPRERHIKDSLCRGAPSARLARGQWLNNKTQPRNMTRHLFPRLLLNSN